MSCLSMAVMERVSDTAREIESESESERERERERERGRRGRRTWRSRLKMTLLRSDELSVNGCDGG